MEIREKQPKTTHERRKAPKIYYKNCLKSRSPASDGLGGAASCAEVGQLLRNRQQASDLKRNRERAQQPNSCTQKNMSGPGRTDDPCYLLLNASKQHSLNKETAFCA